jgi:hypothetical protein
MTVSAGAAVLLNVTSQSAGTYTTNFGETTVPNNIGRDPGLIELMVVELNATTVTTTVDVYIQHSVDGGSNYDDFINLHVAAAAIKYAQWSRSAVSATAANNVHSKSDAALTANTVLTGPVGSDWRIKVVTVGANSAYTLLARQIQRTR